MVWAAEAAEAARLGVSDACVVSFNYTGTTSHRRLGFIRTVNTTVIRPRARNGRGGIVSVNTTLINSY